MKETTFNALINRHPLITVALILSFVFLCDYLIANEVL